MFHINIEHDSNTPLYLQIYNYFVSEIRLGNLKQNEKLPSGRMLAQDIGVSRNTINMAYDQLVSEGYIEAKAQRGYFVCDIEGNIDLSGLNNQLRSSDGILSSRQNNNAISKGQEQVILSTEELIDNQKYDFSPFGIDIAKSPYHRWKKIMRDVMLDQDESLLQNGDTRGDEGLRIAIRDYLHKSRGVQCDESQIIVGAGTDYLLMLLTRLLPGQQSIAMENPVYQQAYKVFRSFNYEINPISLDDNGLNINELKKSDANLVFVTPSHQFPLGIVMPIHRRMQLLNWANESKQRYIIEDDYDSEFRYQGKTIPSLQGIDHQGKVIYLGTFSKSIAPSIRVGYMVLPPKLCEVYREKCSHFATTVSRIDQEIIRRFLVEGYFERHLNRMRGNYRGKHDFMLAQLSKWSIPIRVKGASSGLHIVVEIENMDEAELVQAAAEHGIRVYPLSKYYIEESTCDRTGILLGYANLSYEAIEEGLRELEKVWKNIALQTDCHML